MDVRFILSGFLLIFFSYAPMQRCYWYFTLI